MRVAAPSLLTSSRLFGHGPIAVEIVECASTLVTSRGGPRQPASSLRSIVAHSLCAPCANLFQIHYPIETLSIVTCRAAKWFELKVDKWRHTDRRGVDTPRVALCACRRRPRQDCSPRVFATVSPAALNLNDSCSVLQAVAKLVRPASWGCSLCAATA